MMEKITLNLEAVETKPVTFEFLGNLIKVNPVLSLEDQILLVIHYLDNYFDNSGELIPGATTNYIGAEYALALEILDKYTNVNIAEDKDILLALWKEVQSHISNYDVFKYDIERVIERLASINIDDEGLAKLKATAQELLTGIEQSPVAEVFKESSKQAQLDQVAEAAKSTGRKRKSKKVE
jgi:hypothetical protein